MNTDDNSVVNKISVSKIESAICFSDLPVGNYQLKLRDGGEDCEMGGPSILSDTIVGTIKDVYIDGIIFVKLKSSSIWFIKFNAVSNCLMTNELDIGGKQINCFLFSS